MKEYLALAALLLWPVIPLYWIPVHGATHLFRKIGRLTYLVTGMLWLPTAAVLFIHRERLLSLQWEMPPAVTIGGFILLAAGTVLHIWTLWLLKTQGITGMPELGISPSVGLVECGAFAIIRHPTYLAHTLMLLGIFMATGYAATGCLALLDLAVVQLVIIPLEERELIRRFGDAYESYRRRVARMIPFIKSN